MWARICSRSRFGWLSAMWLSVECRDGCEKLNKLHNPSNIVNKSCTSTICQRPTEAVFLFVTCRQRCDRTTMLFAPMHRSLLAQSGHSRHCNILSAFGQERTLVGTGAE